METKTDPVLIGRILAGAVIAVALLSALLWAVAGRQSGFSMFLDRLVIPMGVGFLIFVATEILRVLTKAQEESGSSIREEQPETRLGRSGGVLRQTSQPIPSAVPARLSGLEQQIMERVGRGDGSISVRSLAEELGVSRESVRETIEDLSDRGVISLD